MADFLENSEAEQTPIMRNLIDTLWSEWKQVEQLIGIQNNSFRIT